MARSKVLAPKKQKVVKISARQNDMINKKYMGEEPVYDPNITLSNSELGRAYSWYTFCLDYDTALDYFVDWITVNRPKILSSVKSIDKQMFKPTHGWTARILSQGGKIEEDVMERFLQYINLFQPLKKEPKEDVTANAPKNRISEFLPDFEHAVDNFQEEFDTYSYLTSNNVPQIYVTKLAEYYTPLIEELDLAIKKIDEQVNEGYRHMSSSEIKSLHLFVSNIVNDCNRFLNNVKKAPKPRKKRAVTPDKLLKNFKYMVEHNQLKLTSVNPEKIIGAYTLYTLNTANNILTIFHAKPGGFTINRTAVMNFETHTSKCKRVGRKVQDVVNNILTGSKSKREKTLDLVSSDFANFTNRLNEKTIILRVDK